MSGNPKHGSAPTPNEGVLQAAKVMPVIEGALAFVVISFIGEVWDSIPEDRRHQAFVLIYASGAHFLFSLLFAAPAMVLCRHNRSRVFALDFSLIVGFFAYVFWSLNEQHRGLANLLIDPPWQIPLPLSVELSNNLEAILGDSSFRLFLSPLILAWGTAIVVAFILWLLIAVVSRVQKKAAPLSADSSTEDRNRS